MIRVEVRIAAAAATDLQEAAAVDAAAVPGRKPAAQGLRALRVLPGPPDLRVPSVRSDRRVNRVQPGLRGQRALPERPDPAAQLAKQERQALPERPDPAAQLAQRGLPARPVPAVQLARRERQVLPERPAPAARQALPVQQVRQERRALPEKQGLQVQLAPQVLRQPSGSVLLLRQIRSKTPRLLIPARIRTRLLIL